MKKLLKSVGKVIKEIGKGLFYEKTHADGKKFSLGRLLLISLFAMSMVIWWGSTNIPTTMLTILLTLIGYNFGTKAVTVIEKLVTKK